MPRIFGYGFNPLSIYFCHHRDGALAALLYEVRNTFGERHTYLIPVRDRGNGTIRQSCEKRFYVSPFMDMDLRYDFRVVPPAKMISVVISAGDAQGPAIVASLIGRRKPLTDVDVIRALAAHAVHDPEGGCRNSLARAADVVKGFVLKPRPTKPAQPVTRCRGEVIGGGDALTEY